MRARRLTAIAADRRCSMMREKEVRMMLADLPALLASLPRLDDADTFVADLDAARAELATDDSTDPCAS